MTIDYNICRFDGADLCGLGELGSLFFEGSEKKVEMVFDARQGSLRSWPREIWADIVAKANATILSTVSDQHCDAFLLSESSLFVYDDRLIMITCGETSLVSAIEEIFLHADLENLRLLVFERKNEMEPEQQPTAFGDDVNYLKSIVDGEAVRLGGKEGNFVHCFYYARENQPLENDVTLEILMHDLDPIAEDLFIKPKRQHLYQETGIQKVFPRFKTDDYFFDPMGYSLNSIGGGDYYTIHVTPQSHCSYASFETNYVFQNDFHKTIEKVLAIFKPGSFSILLFEGENQPELSLPKFEMKHREIRQIAGYRVRFYDFEDPESANTRH